MSGSVCPESKIFIPKKEQIIKSFGVAQFERNSGSVCSGICNQSQIEKQMFIAPMSRRHSTKPNVVCSLSYNLQFLAE
jgi:hypothetical protein